MKSKKIKVVYAEPADYIPEHIRRELKIGEFAEPKEKKECACIDDTKMSDFIDKNWDEYQKAQEKPASDEKDS